MPKPPHSHEEASVTRPRHRVLRRARCRLRPDVGCRRRLLTAERHRVHAAHVGASLRRRPELPHPRRTPPIHRARHRPGRADAPARRAGRLGAGRGPGGPHARSRRARARPHRRSSTASRRSWPPRISATPSWPRPSPATTVELSQLLAGLLRQAPGDRGVAGRPRAGPAAHVVGNRQRVTSTPMRRPRRRSSSCASCTPWWRSNGCRSTGHTHVLFARSLPAVEAIPLLVLEVALVQAGVTTHTVGPELDGRAVAALATRLRPDLLLTWGHPPTPPLRKAMGELEGRDVGDSRPAGLAEGDEPEVRLRGAGAVHRRVGRRRDHPRPRALTQLPGG